MTEQLIGDNMSMADFEVGLVEIIDKLRINSRCELVYFL